MVLIEQEMDAEGTREAPADASSGDAPAEGRNGGDEESLEDALTEEKLRELIILVSCLTGCLVSPKDKLKLRIAVKRFDF